MAYVDVQESCSYCSGTGKVRCSSCNGSGVDYSRNGETCSACYGSGYETCSNCYGSGKVTKSVYRDDSDSSSSYSSSYSSSESSSSSSSSFSGGPINHDGASALSNRAYNASNRGDYDEAIAACTEGINRVRPYLKSWGGWSVGSMCTLLTNRGFAYYKRAERDKSASDKENAISDWKEVLDIDKYAHNARKNLAACGITDYKPLPPPTPKPEPVPEADSKTTAIGAVYGITSVIGLFFAIACILTYTVTAGEDLSLLTAVILFVASIAVSLIVWKTGKKNLIIAVMIVAIFGWLFLIGVIPEAKIAGETTEQIE